MEDPVRDSRTTCAPVWIKSLDVSSEQSHTFGDMKKKELKTAPIAFRLRPSVRSEIERLAVADHRSVSAYVEMLIIEHIEEKARQAKSQKFA